MEGHIYGWRDKARRVYQKRGVGMPAGRPVALAVVATIAGLLAVAAAALPAGTGMEPSLTRTATAACLATCTSQSAGSGGMLAAFSANGGVVLPDPPPPDAPPDVTTADELKALGP